MRSRARTREEWRRLIAEWDRTGERAVDFAARHGVRAKSVWRWHRVLASTALPAREPALEQIVEVRAAQLATAGDGRFEVRLASGRSIGVPPSFDAATLAQLLRVLEASS